MSRVPGWPSYLRRRRAGRFFAAVLAFGLALWLVPHRWCAREAPAWFAGDQHLQAALARGAENWLDSELGRPSFHTGSARFNGEWLYGTYLMTGMGLGQIALEHSEYGGPQWRSRHAQLMGRCLDRLLSAEVARFDEEAWGDMALDRLDGGRGHAAYLGYLNLLLSLHRLVDPHSRFAGVNDGITAALAQRIEASPTLLIESYTGETYPVDVSAGVGSIGLYDRATGADHRALLARWAQRCRKSYLDPRTGLLYQAVDSPTGEPTDAARGSGTCLAAYFLSFADIDLSCDLFHAARQHLAGSVLGFGVMREEPRGGAGRADIDSGPVVLGYGVSATGFALAGARLHDDPALFGRLYATAHLFGAPRDRDGVRHYLTGGPLGDAILLAMLTAPRGGLQRPAPSSPMPEGGAR